MQGNGRAEEILAKLYIEGEGVRKYAREARYWAEMEFAGVPPEVVRRLQHGMGNPNRASAKGKFGTIEPPGPPPLLLVVGAWEKGAQDPEEILADFDRSVKIESFSLMDASGQKIQGDYFTSAFDMAVGIHPESPSAIREGIRLCAEWRVVDRLGRIGEGSGNFTLGRHDHAEGF